MSDVSGLLLANDIVGRLVLRRHCRTIRGDKIARKCRLSAIAKKCTVIACSGGMGEEVEFKCKWVDEELPRGDQYKSISVEISKDCRCDVYTKKMTDTGKGRHVENTYKKNKFAKCCQSIARERRRTTDRERTYCPGLERSSGESVKGSINVLAANEQWSKEKSWAYTS